MNQSEPFFGAFVFYMGATIIYRGVSKGAKNSFNKVVFGTSKKTRALAPLFTRFSLNFSHFFRL